MFTLDDDLAAQARRLGINVSGAARDGVAEAVRRALIDADRAAYTAHPETPDASWEAAEACGAE